MTGREQELIDTVDARTDHNTYERCFCVRREAVWRREGRYITHIEPLFPGYVFVETQDPEAFYLQLKKIPKFSRLLGKDIREKTAGTPEHRTDGRTGKKTEKRRTAEKRCPSKASELQEGAEFKKESKLRKGVSSLYRRPGWWCPLPAAPGCWRCPGFLL